MLVILIFHKVNILTWSWVIGYFCPHRLYPNCLGLLFIYFFLLLKIMHDVVRDVLCDVFKWADNSVKNKAFVIFLLICLQESLHFGQLIFLSGAATSF